MFNSDKDQYAHVGNIPAKLFLYWNTDPSDSLLENIYFHQAIPDLDVQFFKKESAAEWLYDFYGSEAKTVFLSLQHNKQEADFLGYIALLCAEDGALMRHTAFPESAV